MSHAAVSAISGAVFTLFAVGILWSWYRFLKDVGRANLGTRLVTVGMGMMLAVLAWVLFSVVS